MKLKQKLVISFTIILVIFSLAIFFSAYYKITEMVNTKFYNNMETDGELGYLYLEANYQGQWHVQDGKLFKGDTQINDNFKIVDEIRNTTGNLVTIFLDDTRISTTVLTEDGERAIGTKASPEVVEAVLKNGQIFHGQTEVVGREVLTFYRPIKDTNGNIIGMWFTGIEKTMINHDIWHIMLQIGIVLIIMLICGISLSFFFGDVIIKTLKESEEKYRMLFNSAGDSIIVHDMKLQILAVNTVACNRYGYTESELKSMTVNMLNQSSEIIRNREWLARIEKDGYALFETTHRTKNGKLIPVDINAQRITWNREPAIISIHRDITIRKEMEFALNENERLLRESQRVAQIGSYEMNLRTGMWKGSPETDEILGIDEKYPHTLEDWGELIHPEWREKFFANLILVKAEKHRFDYDYVIIRRDNGQERWVHVLGEIQLDDQTNAYRRIGTIQDITDRKTAEKEITYLSYHDKLTGLYNRRFYEEEIIKLDVESNLPISIVIADVNGLKLINDAFGHLKGDELLQKASGAFQSALRTSDIVARWGGDEFVFLLPKTDANEVEAIIKRIKERYSTEQVNALKFSVSFGWQTKMTKDEDILKILKTAEDNMYKNKIVENEGMRGNSISTIIHTLHEKNPREEKHSKRVSEICANIGKAMALPEMEVNKLKLVGLLHDIGKIAIDEGILNNKGKLTALEWEEIKHHPEIGYRILSTSPEMAELANYVLAHHEKWDGTGYPKGLKGEDIPRIARIITLADSYDAMISERPYRKSLSEERVFQEIINNAGVQFDPEIARVFVEKVMEKSWEKENI